MTPAQIIKPFLTQVDRERPDLRITNTALSCFELLKRTLYFAGSDWAFVGKTENMDGGKVYPPEFRPIELDLIRPDGQKQTVQIVGLSMDAAWHIPTMTQVKVIANSSANDDPRPEIHGPARLDPYEIPPKDYRWHNPPISQLLLHPALPPVNQPLPPEPPRTSTILPKGEAYAALQALNAFYQAPEGLQRPGGLVKFDSEGRSVADMEAIAQWFYQLVIEGVSLDNVFTQIRASREWHDKHP